MADYLVKKGETFRNAHHIIGNIVKYCIESCKTIPDLSIAELKKFSGLFEDDIFKKIGMKACLNAKDVNCGTSFNKVSEKTGIARSRIKELKVLLEDLRVRTASLGSVIDSAADKNI